MPAVEKSGLLIRDIEILSLHYAETTREWRRRFLANRAEVLELYDERFIRMWEFYLAGAEMRLPLRRDARLPPAAGPRPGPGAAHPRLHPRGDGAARRGRARLPRLRLAARRAAGRGRRPPQRHLLTAPGPDDAGRRRARPGGGRRRDDDLPRPARHHLPLPPPGPLRRARADVPARATATTSGCSSAELARRPRPGQRALDPRRLRQLRRAGGDPGAGARAALRDADPPRPHAAGRARPQIDAAALSLPLRLPPRRGGRPRADDPPALSRPRGRALGAAASSAPAAGPRPASC